MDKNFTVIFPRLKNIDLIKDPGRIPYYLQNLYQYNCSIVTYENDEYKYLNSVANGLKLFFLTQRITIFSIDLKVLIYLYKNSSKIDVLNLYHYDIQTIIYGLLFKAINPNGIAFLKLDLNYDDFYKNKGFFPFKQKIKKYFLDKLIDLFNKKIDLISYETKICKQTITDIYPILSNKLIHIPNGYDDILQNEEVSWNEKENILLTVGRLGTYQKNTEMLLNALKKVNLNGWKVILIGPVEHTFKEFIDDFFKTNPYMVDKVIFTGLIEERTTLNQYYKKSKLFVLTSRFEGSALVYSEAIYFGNYIISTPMTTMKDITDDLKYGTIVDNEDDIQLAKTLNQILENNTFLEENFENSKEFGRDNFVWSKIIKKLNSELLNRINAKK